MEDPVASYASKNIISPDSALEAEESGWTTYLEDFSCADGSFISSPSLVSDAAWNGIDTLSHVKPLKFKNIRRSSHKKYSCDEDLEDTASSPVNSPKVSNNSKQTEVNCRKFDNDHLAAAGNFLGKRGWPSALSEVGADEMKNGKKVDEYVELRKRGLCLVPMATLINFLG